MLHLDMQFALIGQRLKHMNRYQQHHKMFEQSMIDRFLLHNQFDLFAQLLERMNQHQHRRNHPALCQALPFGPVGIAAGYHPKPLEIFSGEIMCNDKMYERSLYAFTRIYNRLPQSLADMPSVSALQARLTHMAKEKVTQGHEDWQEMLPRLP